MLLEMNTMFKTTPPHSYLFHLQGRIQRGGRGSENPLKNHKNIGFHSNIGPDLLKNHKTTDKAVNIRPPSARQRNAISMLLTGGHIMAHSVVWVLPFPHKTKFFLYIYIFNLIEVISSIIFIGSTMQQY